MQDQKVVRQLFANKGQTVEHGFTSRPEWHGPLPERPTYCDCCIQTDDGRATGRAMIPSVLNNRVYSRDDQASIKALADSRTAAMMAPAAAPAPPVASSPFPKMGTPTGLGRMLQNAQTMFRNAMPSMPSMPAPAPAQEAAGEEDEVAPGASTENAPADEANVSTPPAAEAFRRRARRMRSRAYRRAASFGTVLKTEQSLTGILVVGSIGVAILGAILYKCIMAKKIGKAAPITPVPTNAFLGKLKGIFTSSGSVTPRPMASAPTSAAAPTTLSATANLFT